jgi:glycosyltransferase involved in cell wall biosynthesis
MGDRGMKSLSEARVAIVHEWPVEYAGSEQVVAAMLGALPRAEPYALVHDPEAMRGTPLEGVAFRTSFIQSLPKAKEKYRMYLPFMPLAVEQFDLRGYDIVISSSHAVAKGVLTSANQLHISYTHTPVRYAWDLYLDYLAGSGMEQGIKSWLTRAVLHYVRLWDVCAANRVDAYLANSSYIARRIKKLYRRSAQVIYPPVEVERYRADLPRDNFFITVSRCVPYKRVDLIAETFTKMGKPLVIIGDGPDRARIERLAGPTVKLLGHRPDEVVADYLQRAKSFIFAADEDFGIVPVEAQAAGCPVIAYGKGGTLETIIGWPSAGPTGIFFDAQTPEALQRAVKLFETQEKEFEPHACRRNAERFDRERFHREFRVTVQTLWTKFQRGEGLE